MKRKWVIGLLAVLFFTFGCAATRLTPTSSMGKAGKATRTEAVQILERLKNDYGAPIEYSIEYTVVNGEEVVIERYIFRYYVDDIPVRIIVSIVNKTVDKILTEKLSR